MWLGGIRIDHTLGLLGHSDADVLIHAICDALLGAANMRDIGYHFPDTGAEFKGIDSKVLLRRTIDLIATKGYTVGNIDATVAAVSIKATTTERLGYTGREEGISAYAVCLIERTA